MIPPDSSRKDLKDHTDGSAFQTEFKKKGNKEKQRDVHHDQVGTNRGRRHTQWGNV